MTGRTPSKHNKSDEEPPLLWTRMLREVKDVIRVPVENYQLATLATIKHRSDIIESVDDNDEIEWTEDPYECKSPPATEGSSLIDLIQIQGPPSVQRKDIRPMSIKIDETKWKSNMKRLGSLVSRN